MERGDKYYGWHEKIAKKLMSLGLIETITDDFTGEITPYVSIEIAKTQSTYGAYHLKDGRTLELRFSNHKPNMSFRGFWTEKFYEGQAYILEAAQPGKKAEFISVSAVKEKVETIEEKIKKLPAERIAFYKNLPTGKTKNVKIRNKFEQEFGFSLPSIEILSRI